MTPSRAVLQHASTVPAAGGWRHRLVSEPAGTHRTGTVVAAHAFAEEMNKSRRMCARMARLLAGAGWHVVQLDLLGCGDSSGDFADATWQAWVDDLSGEVRSADAGLPLWLWCQRAGALFVEPLLALRGDANLLLWQPTLSGAAQLAQFLRLHAGARILGSAKPAGGDTPGQRLRAGQRVEVAGYELTPGLAGALEGARFAVPPGYKGAVAWFEVASVQDQPAEVSPAAQQAAASLRQGGARVELRAMGGPQFWQTQEIEDNEILLAASLQAVQALHGTRTTSPAHA